MPENKIDGKYNKEHDYLKVMKKFTRKDMLLLSLHQEWVNTRYNKYEVNIIGYGALFLTINIIGLAYIRGGASDIGEMVSYTMPLIIIMASLRYVFGVRNQINKLNGIRDSINQLCVNDCKD